MAYQDSGWPGADCPPADFPGRHGPGIGIEKFKPVARINQRTAYRKQSQGRQVFLWNSAADRSVRRMNEQNTQAGLPQLVFPIAISRCNVSLERSKGEKYKAIS